ncbi:TRAP transporter small permease [Alkalicoccus saliphilus]|nr:TRAP transporter small permease subunit [Alkalicoccus saliphilus]
MFLSLFLGVVFRYLLSSPLIWATELATFALVWVTFIGGSMGIKQHKAAAVTFLVDKLHGVMRKVLISIGFVIVVGFSVFMIYISISWLSSPNISVQTSTALGVPMLIPYVSVLIGFIFILIHSTLLLVEAAVQEGGQ